MRIHKIIFILMCLLSVRISQANVLGEMQTFSPNTDGFDFITVHSPRQPPKGYFVFSNYVNYARNHLLVYPNIPRDQNQMKYKDALLEYDFGFGYNFTDRLQFTFQAPVLLEHWSDRQNGIVIDLTKGVHSFRPGFKYTLDSSEFPQWAVLGSVDIPNVEDSPYTGVNDTVIPNLEGVYRWKWGSLIQAINVGARYREASERPSTAFMYPLRSQATASYGLSGNWSDTARWVFEVFGSYPLEKKPYDDAIDASSLDLLLGMKHRWFKNLNFDWGGTVEPGLKTLAPDWRLFAGLVYYWQPSFGSSSAGAASDFEVYPKRITVGPQEKVNFTPSEGNTIKHCRVLSGDGLLSSECVYTAPDDVGVAQIEFENERGQRATSIVESKYGATGESLQITPEEPRVSTGGTVQFKGMGGKPPYKFKITSGGGDITPYGFYIAPFKPGPVTITLIDSTGETDSTVVTVMPIAKADLTIQLQNLTFIYDTDRFTPEGERVFEKNVEQLRKVKIRSVIVEGHTDSKGRDEYNMDLSRRRANTARLALIKSLNLQPDQVEAIGFGETSPIATNDTAAGRQKNRRVVLKVYYRK